MVSLTILAYIFNDLNWSLNYDFQFYFSNHFFQLFIPLIMKRKWENVKYTTVQKKKKVFLVYFILVFFFYACESIKFVFI